MISKASLKYIRISPRKFRQIIPLVKGKNAEYSVALLMATKKKAAVYAVELLKSAIANAKNSHQGLDTSTLYISKLLANCGPTMKRFRAASMGRASEILKRTSHIMLELDVAQPKAEEPKAVEHKGHKHEVKHEAHKPKAKEHVKEHAHAKEHKEKPHHKKAAKETKK